VARTLLKFRQPQQPPPVARDLARGFGRPLARDRLMGNFQVRHSTSRRPCPFSARSRYAPGGARPTTLFTGNLLFSGAFRSVFPGVRRSRLSSVAPRGRLPTCPCEKASDVVLPPSAVVGGGWRLFFFFKFSSSRVPLMPVSSLSPLKVQAIDPRSLGPVSLPFFCLRGGGGAFAQQLIRE